MKSTCNCCFASNCQCVNSRHRKSRGSLQFARAKSLIGCHIISSICIVMICTHPTWSTTCSSTVACHSCLMLRAALRERRLLVVSRQQSVVHWQAWFTTDQILQLFWPNFAAFWETWTTLCDQTLNNAHAFALFPAKCVSINVRFMSVFTVNTTSSQFIKCRKKYWRSKRRPKLRGKLKTLRTPYSWFTRLASPALGDLNPSTPQPPLKKLTNRAMNK